MNDKTIKYDERAITVMQDMAAHVDTLARYYGQSDIRYQKAAASHRRVMAQIVMSGFADEARVYRDDDLSLIVHEGNFTYGVIWFPVHRTCTVEGCKATRVRPDGTGSRYRNDDPMCADGQHSPDYPLDAPSPGEWSMHS